MLKYLLCAFSLTTSWALAQLPASNPLQNPSSRHSNSQTHPLFHGADITAGEALIAENKCNECHIRRVGGDGSAIYRPSGRINNAGALRGMVEYCNTELNLGFFPEDTHAVAAVLNLRFYKFRP